jgi:hypothetical protein
MCLGVVLCCSFSRLYLLCREIYFKQLRPRHPLQLGPSGQISHLAVCFGPSDPISPSSFIYATGLLVLTLTLFLGLFAPSRKIVLFYYSVLQRSTDITCMMPRGCSQSTLVLFFLCWSVVVPYERMGRVVDVKPLCFAMTC